MEKFAWVGCQLSRSQRKPRCAASVPTSAASTEKVTNYNASAAVVPGYKVAVTFAPGALQLNLSCSEMQEQRQLDVLHLLNVSPSH